MRGGCRTSITFRQSPASLRATGSRECAPDDRLREAIHGHEERMDCFVADAPLRKRFAFVAGNDGGPCESYGISYTTILSAMPRSAASFWIGLIASRLRMVATAGESMIGPVMWISCEVDKLCTRAAILTV
jgi:hypothetical protein